MGAASMNRSAAASISAYTAGPDGFPRRTARYRRSWSGAAPAALDSGPSPSMSAIRVTRCGRICIGSRKINLSIVFAGQIVGIREVDHQIWQVSFLEYDLGYFDNEQGRVEPGPNPFAPDKVLTMCPE